VVYLVVDGGNGLSTNKEGKMEYYKKVRSGYDIRYIDKNGSYYKLSMNGKFLKSKPFKSIDKDYGYINLNVIDEKEFGLRVID